MLRDSTPRFVGRSVGLLVRPSVRHTLLLLGFCGLWAHCSCPNDQVTSNTAPAHPHATGVAVYPALFKSNEIANSNYLPASYSFQWLVMASMAWPRVIKCKAEPF